MGLITIVRNFEECTCSMIWVMYILRRSGILVIVKSVASINNDFGVRGRIFDLLHVFFRIVTDRRVQEDKIGMTVLNEIMHH